jgi:hypothetical protein
VVGGTWVPELAKRQVVNGIAMTNVSTLAEAESQV